MNAKLALSCFIALMGLTLIIGGFLVFGQSLDTPVLALQTTMASLLFLRTIAFLFYPHCRVPIGDNRGVSTWGYSMLFGTLLSFLVLVWMVTCLTQNFDFPYQLMGHLVLVFLYLATLLFRLINGDKATASAMTEQQLTQRKANLRQRLEQLHLHCTNVPGLSPNVTERAARLADNARFIAPSLQPQALHLEQQLIHLADDLELLLPHAETHQDNIVRLMTTLEQLFQLRKQH